MQTNWFIRQVTQYRFAISRGKMVRSSSTIITYLLFISAAALTTTKQVSIYYIKNEGKTQLITIHLQIEGGKAESELQKKWFEDGNGRFKWSFGCSFPTKGLFALDVSRIKKNQSSACPNLCYEDSRCTHFVFTNGYCYLKSLKFVDASPKDAIYNNSRGLCGFLVERPVYNITSNIKEFVYLKIT